MSCCSEARTAPLTPRHRMKVNYAGGRPVEIVGPVTGLKYLFSGLSRMQLVDPRDAVMIVRNRNFRIEGVVELAAGGDMAMEGGITNGQTGS
jgi:hypothetical protein